MSYPKFAKAAAYITIDAVGQFLMDLGDIPDTACSEIGVKHYLVERMGNSGIKAKSAPGLG